MPSTHCSNIISSWTSQGRLTPSQSALTIRRRGMLLALGLGSLFNHSETPNVDFRRDGPNATIRYYAARDIEQGEELFIFYGSELWFDPV